MSTATIDRVRGVGHAQDIDPDGIEVYCPEAEAWSRTRDFFCESCGATDHDLR